MREPIKRTIADVIRYHRHLDKAHAAGFTADEAGLQCYKEMVRTRRTLHRREDDRALEIAPLTIYDPRAVLMLQEMWEQLTRPGVAIPVVVPGSGISNKTATGAMIRGARVDAALGSVPNAIGSLSALLSRF